MMIRNLIVLMQLAKPLPGGRPEAVEKLFEKYGGPLLRPDPKMKRESQRNTVIKYQPTPDEFAQSIFEES